jgi:RHS repeat-associated protein
VRSSAGLGSVFGYTGEQTDPETGNTYLRARYLDPELGRFLSMDTVQPNAPGTQGYNRCAYVANNPVNWTDPSGHATDQTACGVGYWATVTLTLSAVGWLIVKHHRGVYVVRVAAVLSTAAAATGLAAYLAWTSPDLRQPMAMIGSNVFMAGGALLAVAVFGNPHQSVAVAWGAIVAGVLLMLVAELFEAILDLLHFGLNISSYLCERSASGQGDRPSARNDQNASGSDPRDAASATQRMPSLPSANRPTIMRPVGS